MSMRTSKELVTFMRARVLGESDAAMPPGTCNIATKKLNGWPKDEQEAQGIAAAWDTDQRPLFEKMGSRRTEADRQAIERGEGEGTTVGRGRSTASERVHRRTVR